MPDPRRTAWPSRWSDLSGKNVVVTGASSGIGRATAIALAECGADLILLARSQHSLTQVCQEIEGRCSVRIRASSIDLNNIQATRKLISSFPRVDALVNNAGQNVPQRVEDVDEQTFDSVFALNVKAAFFTAQSCVAKFRTQGGGGTIINVSSQMGHVGSARRTIYCGSKHALEGFTKAMAVELASEGIRVNSVCPTFVKTPMTEPMFVDDGFRGEVIAKSPMGRIGIPEEVAGAIAFLLSPAASLITGSSLLVDGGWTAQ